MKHTKSRLVPTPIPTVILSQGTVSLQQSSKLIKDTEFRLKPSLRFQLSSIFGKYFIAAEFYTRETY